MQGTTRLAILQRSNVNPNICVGFSFSANAVYVGTQITVTIQVTVGDSASATFECQLDNGPFVSCKLV